MAVDAATENNSAFDAARPFIRAGLAGALGWTVIHRKSTKIKLSLLNHFLPPTTRFIILTVLFLIYRSPLFNVMIHA